MEVQLDRNFKCLTLGTEDIIEDVIEPYLMQQGLVQRTQRRNFV